MNHDFINGTLSTAFNMSDRHYFSSHDLQTAIAAELTTRRSSQALSVDQLNQTSEQKTVTSDRGIRDTLAGSSGSDSFVLKPRTGTILIKHFNLHEQDRLELTGGLTFDQITITQGNYCNTHNTLIRTKAGELLAILENIKASTLSNSVFITPTSTGTVASQGDRAMKADVARERFRVDGTGVKVGVLSDSFNALGGAGKDFASGDLPANVAVLADYTGNISARDEGRAMLQIIHDVAPGATLLFHTAYPGGTFTNSLEFNRAGEKALADGIRSLAAAGANVIVDDVGFLTEPMFQDGIVALAIDEIVAKGVAYFTSAGNDDRKSYESSFRNGGFFPGYGAVHDFDTGPGVDIYQNITIPKNTSINLSFQWDSPIAQSSNDLNIYLLNNTNSKVLQTNTGSAPIKILTFRNDGSYGSDTFNLLISNPKGAAPERLKYIVDNPPSGFKINEYDTQSSTIYGHKNASNAVAVGSAPYYLTPAFGTSSAILEPSSSVGGTPILFDQTGQRLTKPKIRHQPKIVAPDGGNITATTGIQVEIQQDTDNLPNFFGTSAAAPHAAAVAALLLQANPDLHPAEINAALERTALDIDDPKTPGFDIGFDDASGYGLIQADRAVAAVVKQLVSTHWMAA